MQQFKLERLEAAFVWLEKEFEQTGNIQSIDLLIMKLDAINSVLSWSSEQMAVAKKNLNDRRVKAYEDYYMSSQAQKFTFPPSVLKQYIDAKCSIEEYGFDLAERLSRSIVHIGDNLRTAISALKSSMMMESYSQSVPKY